MEFLVFRYCSASVVALASVAHPVLRGRAADGRLPVLDAGCARYAAVPEEACDSFSGSVFLPRAALSRCTSGQGHHRQRLQSQRFGAGCAKLARSGPYRAARAGGPIQTAPAGGMASRCHLPPARQPRRMACRRRWRTCLQVFLQTKVGTFFLRDPFVRFSL